MHPIHPRSTSALILTLSLCAGTTVVSAAPSPPPAAPNPLTALCQTLRAEQDRGLSAWKRAKLDIGSDDGATADPSTYIKRGHMQRCTQHAQGVSGPVLVAPGKGKRTSFTWQTVYLNQDGTRTALAGGEFSGGCHALEVSRWLVRRLPSGDEALSTRHEIGCPDGEGDVTERAFRVVAGRLVAVKELAERSFREVDLDKDGYPDAELLDELSVQVPSCEGSESRWSFPVPLHALPDGRFAKDDAVVVEALRRACPKRPAAIIPRDRDHDKALRNLVCARLHGATPQELRKVVGRFCQKPKPAQPCTGDDCGEAPDCADLLCGVAGGAGALLDKPLPVLLTPAAPPAR